MMLGIVKGQIRSIIKPSTAARAQATSHRTRVQISHNGERKRVQSRRPNGISTGKDSNLVVVFTFDFYCLPLCMCGKGVYVGCR